MAATPTRNTTVPAANRKPKNRTSKRIIEYPFQPCRQTLPTLSPVRQSGATAVRIAGFRIPARNFSRFIGLGAEFYSVVAVAKLGLHCPPAFQLPGPAVAKRLAKKASIACATEPALRERQPSDTRCSRSSLFET